MSRQKSGKVKHLWINLALIIACCFWGTTFLFAKIAMTELPVAHVLLYRFCLSALLFFFLLLRRKRTVHMRDMPLFLLSGFLTVPVTFLLQFTGLALTTVTNAALIIGMVPPLLTLAAIWFLHEQLTLWNWLATGLSLLGLILLIGGPQGHGQLIGEGLVFLSVLSVVGWTMINTYLSRKYSAFDITAYSLISGTILLIPIALWWNGLPRVSLSLSVWLALLALGPLCTVVTFALWNWGLKFIGASRAGIYLNLEPLVGALLGVIVMRDPFGIHLLIGGFLIILAAFTISFQRSTPPSGESQDMSIAIGPDGL